MLLLIFVGKVLKINNMTRVNKILKSILILSSSFMLLQFSYAQNGSDKKKQQEADLKTNINNRHFVFVAQSVSPMSGGSRNLTSTYDLTISGDTLTSNLPYFGRAYSAPINPSDGGINFTTNSYKWIEKPRKKGGWEIQLNPKNGGDVRQMALTISPNGSSLLRVISNNRQPISFSGYTR